MNDCLCERCASTRAPSIKHFFHCIHSQDTNCLAFSFEAKRQTATLLDCLSLLEWDPIPATCSQAECAANKWTPGAPCLFGAAVELV